MNTLTEKTQQWLNDVASGKLTMSQRKVDVLVKSEGGLEAVIKAAKEQQIHLLRLTDDKGTELVAASLTPFSALC